MTQVPIGGITSRAGDYPPPLVSGAVGDLPSEFAASLMMAAPSPVLGTDIRAKVTLDGRAFTANIDTGLDISTINSEAARDTFHVAFEPSDKPEARTDQSPQAGTETVTVTGWRQQHRFHALTFGGVTVMNPLFVLKPAPADAHRAGAAQSPDITIGMNVLRKLHLYFAFGERMLYVSAAQAETQKNSVKLDSR